MSGGNEFRYLLGSTAHHQPQFNGASPFGPPVLRTLWTKDETANYDQEFLDVLEENGARLVVVHVHALAEKSEAVRTWLRAGLASGRLAYLRSFDHDVGGDFVFALADNLPAWSQLVDRDVPDGAGDLPRQKLEKMLAGKPTHSDQTMIVVESPTYGQDVHGKLRIRGWTLSPVGIASVTALIHNGEKRIPLSLAERSDVKQRYSWYYFTPQPGFDAEIQKPKGVPERTELQIEVVDRAKRVTRSEDVLIQWK